MFNVNSLDILSQGRINHSGPHTHVRRGPFSRTRTQDFLSRGALFFSQKVDDLFISVVCEHQHNVSIGS